MKRWLRIIIPLAILLFLIAARLIQNQLNLRAEAAQRKSMLNAPAIVTAAPVRVEDLERSFNGVGSVEAPLNVNISA